MKKMNRIVAAFALMMGASTAFAGTPPTIKSACVTFPEPEIIRISGIVTDPDFDAISVTPLVIGACVNGSLNVVGTTYTCDAPAAIAGYTVGLVPSDAEGNFGSLVDVELKLGCKFY